MPLIILDETNLAPVQAQTGDDYLIEFGSTFSGRIENAHVPQNPDGTMDDIHNVSVRVEGTYDRGLIFLNYYNSNHIVNNEVFIADTAIFVGGVNLRGSGNSVENHGIMDSGLDGQTVVQMGADYNFLNTGTITGLAGALFAHNSRMENAGSIAAQDYSFVLEGNNSEMINSGSVFASDVGFASHAVRLIGDHNVFRNTGTVSNTDGSTSAWIVGEDVRIFNDGNLGSTAWTGSEGRLVNGLTGVIDTLDVEVMAGVITNSGDIDSVYFDAVGGLLINEASGTIAEVEVVADNATVRNFGFIDDLQIPRDGPLAPSGVTIRNLGEIDTFTSYGENAAIRNLGAMEYVDFYGSDSLFINDGTTAIRTAEFGGDNNVFRNNGDIYYGPFTTPSEGDFGHAFSMFGNNRLVNRGNITTDHPFNGYFVGTIALEEGPFVPNMNAVSEVINEGTITGITGIDVNITAVIRNRGDIYAESGGILSWGGAPSGVQELTVYNSGTIEIWGYWNAAITGWQSADFVRNTGTIIGDIYLDQNNDIYNGRSGSLDGTIYAGAGRDLVNSGADDDVIYGQQGVDTLSSHGGDDLIYAGGSADVVYGGNGADMLHGQSGNDALFGGGQADTIFGGAGDDLIDGGRGADALTGGLGADSFVFSLDSGRDVVSDFSAGEDHIDLSLFGVTFADIQAASNDTGEGLRIDLSALGGHGTVVLTGITEGGLGEADFLL